MSAFRSFLLALLLVAPPETASGQGSPQDANRQVPSAAKRGSSPGADPSVPRDAARDAAAGPSTALVAGVDRILGELFGANTPGCAVSVERQGVEVLAHAVGLADLEHGVAITVDTVFEAASVSKQFVAAAAMLLVERGKLTLDAPVRRFFPQLPPSTRGIEVQHLIYHTSGLRDWGGLAAIEGWPRGARVHTNAHALEILERQRGLNHPPGAEYAYTNSGYNLLAMLIEQVTGEPLADFTEREIFVPLGMTSTRWRTDFRTLVPVRAVAYEPEKRPEGAPPGPYEWKMPFEDVYGNGGLLTTVRDLQKWNRNFHHHLVGGKGLTARLLERGRLNNGHAINYGGGIIIYNGRCRDMMSHMGTTAGYRSYLLLCPAERLSLALLCNAGKDVPVERLGAAVLDLVAPNRAVAREVPSEGPEPAFELDPAFTGIYRRVGGSDSVRVEAREDGLYFGDRKLVARSPMLFELAWNKKVLFRRMGGRLGFEVDGNYGTSASYERVPPPRLSARALRRLTGRYVNRDARAEHLIALRPNGAGPGLTLQIPPNPPIDLIPVYRDGFETEDGWILRFVQGGGRVRGFVLTADRVRDLRFSRRSDLPPAIHRHPPPPPPPPPVTNTAVDSSQAGSR